MEEQQLKNWRIKSFIGVFIMILCLILATIFKDNGLAFLTFLAGSIGGWIFFSNNHAKIAIYNLKKITEDYIKNVNK
jgi:hypothetical protein